MCSTAMMSASSAHLYHNAHGTKFIGQPQIALNSTEWDVQIVAFEAESGIRANCPSNATIL